MKDNWRKPRPTWTTADQALIEFNKRSDLPILQAQSSAKQSALGEYLGLNESLLLLQQNVKDLQAQLARRPADSPSNLGDDLAQMMLQVNALSTQARSLPILLQMPSAGSLSDSTVGEQAAYLADLAKTVESKQADVKKQAEALPVEIKTLQGQIQETSTEAARLTRERDLSVGVYTTLAQKVKETQISAQDDAAGSVRLAGAAVTPDRRMSRNLLRNTVLGLILGLMAIVGVVFAMEYFQQPVEMPADLRPEHAIIEESLDHRAQVKEARG